MLGLVSHARISLNSSTLNNTDSKSLTANPTTPIKIPSQEISKSPNAQLCHTPIQSDETKLKEQAPTPITPTNPSPTPLPSNPSGFRIPDSGKEHDYIQETVVTPNDRKKRGWGGPGGKKRICLNAGRAKSKKTICDIMALHRKGYSNYRIGKELGISNITVAKYLRRGDDGLEIPTTRVEVLPTRSTNTVVEYEPRRSLQHSLTQIERMKAAYDKLLDDEAIPAILTPLNLLQLAQAERTILQVPGEIAKQQADLYEQIQNRRLECADDEVAELGQAGEMGT